MLEPFDNHDNKQKILSLNTDKVQDLNKSLLYSAAAYRWRPNWVSHSSLTFFNYPKKLTTLLSMNLAI